MHALTALLNRADIQAQLQYFFVAFAGTSGFVSMTPWIAPQVMPRTLRTGVAGVLALAIFQTQFHGLPPFTSVTLWGVMLVQHALRGALYGLVCALPLHAASWAGQWADLWRGVSNAEIPSLMASGRSSPLGEFYVLMAIIVFFGAGGHLVTLEGFLAAPAQVSNLLTVKSLVWPLARSIADALELAAQMAFPVAFVVVAIELVLGFLGRTAPQISLYFLGMPLRATGALAVTMLGLGVWTPEVLQAVVSVQRWALTFMR